MFNLDSRFDSLCGENRCVYTRYADDLCISSDEHDMLLDVEEKIRTIVSETSHPKLVLNEKKRHLATLGSRRCITGLVLTPQGDVKIPRCLKRRVRALIYRRTKEGDLSSQDAQRLTGYLGYINDCEPNYLNNLVMKYGADTIRRSLQRENNLAGDEYE
jgi:RNA-directed DNA polymerase